jgi:hypothetical protein
VFSKLSKTAQSRERTGRPLLKALSQLSWPHKGREVWFSLGENHERAGRFGLLQLRNCVSDFCSPPAPSRCAGMLRTDIAFDVTLAVAITTASRRQALMLSRWLAADARVGCAGARPGRAVVKTALTCGFLVTLWYGFWAASRAGEDFFGNHGGALFLHIRAMK